MNKKKEMNSYEANEWLRFVNQYDLLYECETWDNSYE